MSENRTFDGSGNNLEHNDWGRAGTHLLRFTKPSYYGGGNIPSGQDRPNPRLISNLVCQDRDDEGIQSRNKLSHFMWAWGQFLDHEIDLSPEGEAEEIEIPVPDDPGTMIRFSRSVFDPTTGTSLHNPRQQVNVLSAYVDASNVYGADETRATALRAMDGTGKLKTSSKAGKEPRELLPFNVGGLPNASFTAQNKSYVAGDVRANEHSVLVCMHTLFVREHNRICDDLSNTRGTYKEFAKALPPNKPGKQRMRRDAAIFQRARKIVGALMQVITYEEFLPALLGKNALKPYAGYNSRVNAGVSNIFSTVAYRLGHSMLPAEIPLVDSRGRSDSIDFGELFFCPELIPRHGIDVFLRGLYSERMQEVDNLTVEPIRSSLFKNKTNELLDLASLNIQRGRDHGIPDYNQCRFDYNLSRKATFGDISSNEDTQTRLASAYEGDVDRIDPWIGAISEDHVWHVNGVPVDGRMKGATRASVGELIFTVLKDQFERLRDGDRFWYENDATFGDVELRRLKRTKLSHVIERNTGIKNVPPNVFKVT